MANVSDDSRPRNIWRICGHRLNDSPGRGCTCTSANPSDAIIAEAATRLGMTLLPKRRRRSTTKKRED